MLRLETSRKCFFLKWIDTFYQCPLGRKFLGSTLGNMPPPPMKDAFKCWHFPDCELVLFLNGFHQDNSTISREEDFWTRISFHFSERYLKIVCIKLNCNHPWGWCEPGHRRTWVCDSTIVTWSFVFSTRKTACWYFKASKKINIFNKKRKWWEQRFCNTMIEPQEHRITFPDANFDGRPSDNLVSAALPKNLLQTYKGNLSFPS